jgi:hypothetical protein
MSRLVSGPFPFHPARVVVLGPCSVGITRIDRGRDHGYSIIVNIIKYGFYKRFPPPGKTMVEIDPFGHDHGTRRAG